MPFPEAMSQFFQKRSGTAGAEGLVRNNSIRPNRRKNRTVRDEQELKKLEAFVPACHEFTGRQIVNIECPDVHQSVILPKIAVVFGRLDAHGRNGTGGPPRARLGAGPCQL
jgi:hypothetical protein